MALSEYSLEAGIKALQALAADLHDGLKMLRLIGPDLDPSFNDQVGLAKLSTNEQGAISTNRSGKSTVCAAKIAAAARNVPLIAWNGEKIDCRQPQQKGRPLVIWVIGLQLNHIGQTIFRLLFQEGSFRMIPDEDTGAWRAWRPWDKADVARENRCRPGPPLIPPSEIDHDTWEWESKAGKQVAGVKLRNGTQFYFYASTADVKMGDPVDIIWIDEAIKYSSHYAEWMMRLTDYRGWILWSTMFRAGVPALTGLLERAELQQEQLQRGEREKLTAKCIFFTQAGNPFLPKERIAENREFLETLGEEELAMRADGGIRFDNTLIYPFFNKRTHAAIPPLNSLGEPLDVREWDNLAHVLKALNGIPPKDWCHDLIIDPGAQKPAVLFCAVPPTHWRDAGGKEWFLWADSKTPFYIVYDEIYGKRYALRSPNPELSLPHAIRTKMRGVRFRRFIMDMQAGRQTPTTGGKTVAQQYADVFMEYGLESEETGNHFVPGSPDFAARKEVVTGWMQIHGCGKPLLRVVTQNCPNLVWQLSRNQFAMDGDIVTNKEARKERNDLRVCCEYWASRNPRYVRIEQTYRNPAWINHLPAWEHKYFGGQEETSDRIHFGPGVA